VPVSKRSSFACQSVKKHPSHDDGLLFAGVHALPSIAGSSAAGTDGTESGMFSSARLPEL